MTSQRIKGQALRLTVGTGAVAEDYWADVTACTLENEEADTDVVTFEDAQTPGGARQYLLNITAIQSTDPTSLWSFIWDQTGEEVPFVYAPHGNENPSAAQPHFTGTVKIGARPSIGGEAGATNTYTFETSWEVQGTPLKDDGN